MGAVNFRNAYELYPETYPGEGGLPGMLRAVLQQQNQWPGTNLGSTANGALGDGYENYDSPQGGLLGRLLALQAEQSQQQPPSGDNAETPLERRNPNFRQVSRAAMTIGPPGAIGPSIPSDDQSSPNYSPVGNSNSLVSMNAPSQGAGLFGGYSEKPASSWVSASPSMTAIPVGWRANGIPFPGPMPPMRPDTSSPPPVPPIVELWHTTKKLLQIYQMGRYGRQAGGGGDDEDECDKRLGEETGRCYARSDEYAHQDFLPACKERAKDRWDLCIRNGRRFPPREPPEWGTDDEEVWLNLNR